MGSKDGQLVTANELKAIYSTFPNGIIHAFGYGSGVFAQKDIYHVESDVIEKKQQPSQPQPMLDLIFVVEDSKIWHEENLGINRSHYALLPRAVGPDFVSRLQKWRGGKVYFNPLVSVQVSGGTTTHNIKYGVIEKTDLMNDLLNWEYLYIAGRMHKPTVLFESAFDVQIIDAQEKNIQAALSAALLMKDEGADGVYIKGLFESIANISYAGDPRMKIGGEDPDKVSKLVQSPGQVQRWINLYKQPIDTLRTKGLLSIDWNDNNPKVEWDARDYSAHMELSKCLPSKFTTQQGMVLKGEVLASVLASIVSPAAKYQSMKGIICAGIGKSIRYAGAKFAKGWKI